MHLKQIFLIDDDVEDQELFISALGMVDVDLGCKTASNGQDALNLMQGDEVSPDLIFLDLNMPKMNGHQFLNKIKKEQKFKHIPVIIFTTSSNPETAREVKQLGATDLITKPNTFNELVVLLKTVVNTYAM